MKKKDLVGQRFGKLTVIAPAEPQLDRSGKPTRAMWLCRCECGNLKEVSYSNLKMFNVTSCGCARDAMLSLGPSNRGQPLEGLRFGKLLVLHRYSRDLAGAPVYVCRCDCGIEVAYSSRQLCAGAANSCGVCCDETDVVE